MTRCNSLLVVGGTGERHVASGRGRRPRPPKGLLWDSRGAGNGGNAGAALLTRAASAMATEAKRRRVSRRRRERGAPLSAAPLLRSLAGDPGCPPRPLPLPRTLPPLALRSAPASRAFSRAGPFHGAGSFQVAEPVGGSDADADPDPVPGFLSWCRQVGLELSPKVKRRGLRAGVRGGGGGAHAFSDPRLPGPGGGEPAGNGGRLRHGGPGERAARGAAVRRAAGRPPFAAHLLHWRPAGARWVRRRGRDGEAGRAAARVFTSVSPSERGALQSQSGWVPLLLALLHELQAPASPWSPYFALWPELGRLEHPMFW